MAAVDSQILSEFLGESKSLIQESYDILEEIEGQPKLSLRLLEYANRVDRVMGAARSLATMVGKDHALHLIGDCTGLCKAVGTRGAALSSANEGVFDVTVSFLLDANDVVDNLLSRIQEPASVLRNEMQNTFVERLRWLSDLYRNLPEPSAKGSSPGASKGDPSMDQAEIDALLKKLGI